MNMLLERRALSRAPVVLSRCIAGAPEADVFPASGELLPRAAAGKVSRSCLQVSARQIRSMCFSFLRLGVPEIFHSQEMAGRTRVVVETSVHARRRCRANPRLPYESSPCRSSVRNPR